MGNTVKRLCDVADITGNKTNHSLRATTATRGLELGIPEKLLMERTRHRSVASLHQYQRPSEEEKMLVSHLLDDGEKGNEGATEDTRTFKRLCVGRKQDAEKAVSTTTGKGGVITFQNCTMHINNFNL